MKPLAMSWALKMLTNGHELGYEAIGHEFGSKDVDQWP